MVKRRWESVRAVDRSWIQAKESSNWIHDALPHNYIDPDLPKAMEASLQAVTQDLETTKVKSSKIAQRIKFMSQYFE